jgi:branched-chain amino acid transport system ATP-binding protein
MTLLTLQQVTRRFGGLVAVDAVDLAVEQGGVTAIIGPNGAGKTTLFHMISGFQTPNAGRIMFDGNDITGLPPNAIAAHGLIRTFQQARIFPHLTLVENLSLAVQHPWWAVGKVAIQPADRAAWFASYREFILRFATLAADERVEMLCVGTELVTLSGRSFADSDTALGMQKAMIELTTAPSA